MRALDVPDARVGEAGDDRRGVVGRRVVDDQQLEVALRLREHAVDRDRQQGGPVVRGDDDREARNMDKSAIFR
jgi:hypothetical protein